MHYFGLIDSLIWISSTVAGCILAAIMLRRRLVRSYPVFFASIVFDVARETTLPLLAYANTRAYEYGYWLLRPVVYIVALAVLLEIYRYSLVLKRKLPVMIVIQLVSFGAVLLGLVAYSLFKPTPAHNLLNLILVLDRTICVLRCALLVFVLTFAPKLGLSWRHHVWGIVLGMGLCAASEMVQSSLSAFTGIGASGNWLARVPPCCYLISVILWTAYLGRPEPARDPATLEKLSLLNYILRTYNKILNEIGRTMNNENHS